MKEHPDQNVIIEGHTDNVGGKKYNLNLSQKRAEAVRNIMVTKFNIDPSRITAKGFGYSKTNCQQRNQGRKTEKQKG